MARPLSQLSELPREDSGLNDSGDGELKTKRRAQEIYNIALIGDTYVGKTAFADALLFGASSKHYLGTTLDCYEANGIVEFVSPGRTFLKLKKLQLRLIHCRFVFWFRCVSCFLNVVL